MNKLSSKLKEKSNQIRDNFDQHLKLKYLVDEKLPYLTERVGKLSAVEKR